MAIQTNDETQGQATPEPQRSFTPVGFKDALRSQSSGLVAQGGGGEYFVKVREFLAKAIPNIISDEAEVSVISISRQEYRQLRFSALTLATKVNSIDGTVAYYTVILEATGEKLASTMMNLDNQVIPVRRVTGDAADAHMRDLVHNLVLSLHRGSNCINAGFVVLPSSVKLSDESILENIVHLAGSATVSEIFRATNNFPKLNLADFGVDSRMVIDIGVGGNTAYDALGNPIRSSAILSMNIVDNNAPRNRANNLDVVNAPEQSINVCTVNGFINPVWADQGNQLLAGFGVQQAPMMRQPKLQAEFVITGIDSQFSGSPAAVMLAVSSVYALADNNNWVQLLLPIGAGAIKDGDINDIGALNVICDTLGNSPNGLFSSPISLSSIRNEHSKIVQYLDLLFRSGLMVSIDCQECGPNSWSTNVFLQAYTGNRDAILEISNVLDDLTDGHFSQNFDVAKFPIFTNMIRIPTGAYYVNGQKRDIRDYDLTAMCNRFASNPQEIHNWINTFDLSRGLSEPTLVTTREGYIEHAISNQCEINSYARRLTFSAEFLAAYSASIAACKVNTQVNTPLAAEQLRVGMVAPQHIQNSVLATGNSTFAAGAAYSSRPMVGYGIPGMRQR